MIRHWAARRLGAATSVVAALVLAFSGGGAARADRPAFYGIGAYPAAGLYESAAYGVSADGRVVAAELAAEYNETAAYWTREEGVVPLTNSAGEPLKGTSYGISGDGSTMVGHQYGGKSLWRTLLWTRQAGAGSAGDYGTSVSTAYAASSDGSVVVGYGGDRAFRWTARTGAVPLGRAAESWARDVSGDGSVVVGYEHAGGSAYVPTRWGPGGEFRTLDVPRGSSGYAYGVSTDGSVVVGAVTSTPPGARSRAVLWRDAAPPFYLDSVSGGPSHSVARAVADNGVIVGDAGSQFQSEAFVWDATRGMRNLHAVLADDLGLDVAGWRLMYAWDISADGRTIVGTGINPRGRPEGFVAVLPEPGAAALLASPVLQLLRRRQRGRTIRRDISQSL